MQWNIALNGKSFHVQLPDCAPDNAPFDATINGRQVKLRWQRNTKTLFILDNKVAGVWTALNLRSRTISKFSGENDLNINAEFLPACSDNPIAMDATVAIHLPGQEGRAASAAKKPLVIRSQITGKVLKVLVQNGNTVNAGDTVMIIEAMKMENRVIASAAGVVDTIKVKEGDTVSSGAELLKFKQK